MIHRPPDVGRFQFVILATLRAAQLMRGCRPRVDGGHKPTVTAQLEVSEGLVMQVVNLPEKNGKLAAIGAVSEEVPVLVPTI